MRLLCICQAVGLCAAMVLVFSPSSAGAQSPLNSKMALNVYEGYHTNTPKKFVRVRADGVVFVAPIDSMTDNDATNAEFRKRAGLSDSKCFSFESAKYPGRFLRHTNYQIKLQQKPIWSRSFNDAATFCYRQMNGLGYGYESFNAHGYFIRHENSGLWIRPINSGSDYPAEYNASTFIEQTGPVHLNLRFVGCMLGKGQCHTDEGDYRIVWIFGPCTGATGWGSTKTTRAYIYLENNGFGVPFSAPPTRLVLHSATSQPVVGFSPIIKLYIPREQLTSVDSGPVAKIGFEQTVCYY